MKSYNLQLKQTVLCKHNQLKIKQKQQQSAKPFTAIYSRENVGNLKNVSPKYFNQELKKDGKDFKTREYKVTKQAKHKF